MSLEILKVVWILLPAALANAVPPIVAKIFPWWNHPLDFNQKIKGKRILGSHKTFRGLLSGIVAAHLLFVWQKNFTLAGGVGSDEIVNLYSTLPYYFGILLGFSSLLGDALKSAIKRRVKRAPGVPWFPFDQIDWIITSCIFVAFYMDIGLSFVAIALALGLFGSLLGKVLGWLFGINDKYI